MTLIEGHKWRPLSVGPTRRIPERGAASPCGFMNCRMPRTDHVEAVKIPYRGWRG